MAMRLCIPEHYLLFRQEDLIVCMLATGPLATGPCLYVSIKLRSGVSSLGLQPQKNGLPGWL